MQIRKQVLGAMMLFGGAVTLMGQSATPQMPTDVAPRQAGATRQAQSPVGQQQRPEADRHPGRMTNPMGTTATSASVTLSPGDLLTIAVFQIPELTQEVRVDDRGDVIVQPIGTLHVEGMRPQDAAGEIAKELKDKQIVLEPQVSIFVEEYASQGIFIDGQVLHPGAYPLLGSYHLSELIATAGGQTQLGSNEVTITHRDGTTETAKIRLHAGEAGVPSNPLLRPGDDIYVPTAGVVYVLGEVAHPGGYLLDPDSKLTVLRALSLAAGPTQVASKGGLRLIRTNPNGERVVIAIGLDDLLKSKTADFAVQRDDIIYVPRDLKRIFSSPQFLQQVIATAAGASVYRW